jgi:fructosamine-3-kinase
MTLPPGATDAVRVGGGDINEGWRVLMSDGTPAFVKTRSDARASEYEREAASLRWLAEPASLRVPEVLEVGADYLALRWIERGRLTASGEEELGSGLALVHGAGAPHFGEPPFELHGPASIGSLSLPNEPTEDWPSFYVDRRLQPSLSAAVARGAIDSRGQAAVHAVCERMQELAGPAEPPARLHGDLWSGNVLAGEDGRPWIIDPTSYGGHREIDIAMLLLFGAPSERFFAAYEEVAPLAAGWRERVPLWQLLPLLVHAALFGGGYGAQASRVASSYAS